MVNLLFQHTFDSTLDADIGVTKTPDSAGAQVVAYDISDSGAHPSGQDWDYVDHGPSGSGGIRYDHPNGNFPIDATKDASIYLVGPKGFKNASDYVLLEINQVTTNSANGQFLVLTFKNTEFCCNVINDPEGDDELEYVFEDQVTAYVPYSQFIIKYYGATDGRIEFYLNKVLKFTVTGVEIGFFKSDGEWGSIEGLNQSSQDGQFGDVIGGTDFRIYEGLIDHNETITSIGQVHSEFVAPNAAPTLIFNNAQQRP
jgi:hypothetical protein